MKKDLEKEVIAIIPIRDDSTRLPNKATGFKIYNKLTPMECLAERLLLSEKIDHILFLVPFTKENDYLINKINSISIEETKIKVFSGNINDISKRALEGVKEICFYPEETVLVNLTGDCPLIDPFQIDYLIDKFMEEKTKNLKQYLYISNVVTRSYPDGFDIQIYDYTLLKLTRYISLDKKQTTNLGWDIINYSGYLHDIGFDLKILNYPASEELWHPEWGLVLDYEEDIEVIKSIYNHFDRFDFTLEEVIYYIENNQQILTNKYRRRKIPGE